MKIRKRNGKFRLVSIDGRIARNTRTGKRIDGGGHEDREKAARQIGHINDNSKGES